MTQEQKPNQQDQYALAPAKPQGFLVNTFDNAAKNVFSFCKHFFGASSIEEDRIRRKLLQAHLNGEGSSADHYRYDYEDSLRNKAIWRIPSGICGALFSGLILLMGATTGAAVPIGVVLFFSGGLATSVALLGTGFLAHEKKEWLEKYGRAEQLMQHWDYKARVKAHKRLARKQQRTLAHIRQDNP